MPRVQKAGSTVRRGSEIHESNVEFDRNGVASVKAETLLQSPRVQAAFAAGKKIVEAHKAQVERERAATRRFVRRHG